MTGPGEFSIEEAEAHLGPAAAAEAKRSAEEAPDLRPEQIEYLRILFGVALAPQPSAADAA